ncbi:MAG: hypothetical protein M3N98_03785 [Actinomycetota bacterium]|nr:hypothetical protein [Actinomycetota bacterium]
MVADPPAPAADPILLRRARYASLARLGKAIGYGLLLVAIIAFVAGFASNFASATVAICITGLIGACIVLPPAIIAGYAVKAAEREDRRTGLL